NANGALILASNYVFAGSGANRRLISWRSGTNIAALLDGTSNTLLVGEKHVPITRFGEGPWDSSVYNADTVTGPAFRQAGRDGTPPAGPHPPPNGQTATVHRPPPFAPAPTLTRPSEPIRSDWRFGSYHSGVCQFVLADGSVRAIPATVDIIALTWLAIRND